MKEHVPENISIISVNEVYCINFFQAFMTVIYLRYEDLEHEIEAELEIEADIKADSSPDYLIYIGVMALLGFVMLVCKPFFLILYYNYIHTYTRTR